MPTADSFLARSLRPPVDAERRDRIGLDIWARLRAVEDVVGRDVDEGKLLTGARFGQDRGAAFVHRAAASSGSLSALSTAV